MKIIKSLGLKGMKNSFKKQEVLLLKCECGVILKKSRNFFEQRPQALCGLCSAVPSAVMNLESKFMAKGCEIVAFRVIPKEDTNYSKWLEIVYEKDDQICKTKVSYNTDYANNIKHWSSPWNKREESGTQENGENQSLLQKEERPMQNEKEVPMESLNEKEGETMSSTTETPSESQTLPDTIEQQILSSTNTGRSEVLAERSMSMREEILKDVTLINESAQHLYDVMKGLTPTFNSGMNPTNAIKVADVIVEHVRKDVGIVQAKINCAKEIKSLLSLKLDYAKFAKEHKETTSK